jgi:hypothetical protein
MTLEIGRGLMDRPRIRVEHVNWFGANEGVKWVYVHDPSECAGQRRCPIHKPHDWIANVEDWPYVWRSDIGLLERLCKHGVGHPDKDQDEYLAATGRDADVVHGCCGCCAERRTVFNRMRKAVKG